MHVRQPGHVHWHRHVITAPISAHNLFSRGVSDRLLVVSVLWLQPAALATTSLVLPVLSTRLVLPALWLMARAAL